MDFAVEPLGEAAGWVAAVVTVVGVSLTAANLGARVTGWGFVALTAASLLLLALGAVSGVQSLVFTHATLSLINAFGVWRWLGQRAQYEAGGMRAAHRSHRGSVPSLLPIEALVGSDVYCDDGTRVGSVVDVMLRCQGADIAYMVIGHGKIGEELRAVGGGKLALGKDGIAIRMSEEEFFAQPVLEKNNWPAALPEPDRDAGQLARRPAG